MATHCGEVKGNNFDVSLHVPSTGLFFMTYELLKRTLTPSGQSTEDLSVGRILIAGGIAGCSCGLFMPLDTLKSRFQTAPHGKYPNGLRDVIMDLALSEGARGFCKGLTPYLIRAFPANAACFLGAEMTMKALNRFSTTL
ncbi:mitochondrial carnitine/acylcarnitine carrier protein-like [Ptychodera flava]|uniref:mitochondrial carnitine/acylcarnitine carrier protein-like n=1 Tax=Ptychodera flava TaxID=63121 RepID=UPI00396A8FBE